jgi:hypothetical protein
MPGSGSSSDSSLMVPAPNMLEATGCSNWASAVFAASSWAASRIRTWTAFPLPVRPV